MTVSAGTEDATSPQGESGAAGLANETYLFIYGSGIPHLRLSAMPHR